MNKSFFTIAQYQYKAPLYTYYINQKQITKCPYVILIWLVDIQYVLH